MTETARENGKTETGIEIGTGRGNGTESENGNGTASEIAFEQMSVTVTRSVSDKESVRGSESGNESDVSETTPEDHETWDQTETATDILTETSTGGVSAAEISTRSAGLRRVAGQRRSGRPTQPPTCEGRWACSADGDSRSSVPQVGAAQCNVDVITMSGDTEHFSHVQT